MAKTTWLGAGVLSSVIGAVLTVISIGVMRSDIPELELIGALGCALGLFLFAAGILFKSTLVAWVVIAVNGGLLLLVSLNVSWKIVSWQRTLYRPETIFFIASVLLEVFALVRVLTINSVLPAK